MEKKNPSPSKRTPGKTAKSKKHSVSSKAKATTGKTRKHNSKEGHRHRPKAPIRDKVVDETALLWQNFKKLPLSTHLAIGFGAFLFLILIIVLANRPDNSSHNDNSSSEKGGKNEEVTEDKDKNNIYVLVNEGEGDKEEGTNYIPHAVAFSVLAVGFDMYRARQSFMNAKSILEFIEILGQKAIDDVQKMGTEINKKLSDMKRDLKPETGSRETETKVNDV